MGEWESYDDDRPTREPVRRGERLRSQTFRKLARAARLRRTRRLKLRRARHR